MKKYDIEIHIAIEIGDTSPVIDGVKYHASGKLVFRRPRLNNEVVNPDTLKEEVRELHHKIVKEGISSVGELEWEAMTDEERAERIVNLAAKTNEK